MRKTTDYFKKTDFDEKSVFLKQKHQKNTLGLPCHSSDDGLIFV